MKEKTKMRSGSFSFYSPQFFPQPKRPGYLSWVLTIPKERLVTSVKRECWSALINDSLDPSLSPFPPLFRKKKERAYIWDRDYICRNKSDTEIEQKSICKVTVKSKIKQNSIWLLYIVSKLLWMPFVFRCSQKDLAYQNFEGNLLTTKNLISTLRDILNGHYHV